MKKIILALLILILSGCAIQTETEFVIDKETEEAIIAQLMEDLSEELKITYQPDLEVIEDLLKIIVETNKRAFIGVSNYQRKGINDYQLAGTGSGFIYDYDDGFYYAITNAHVVDGADQVKVVLENGDIIEVEPIFNQRKYVADNETDIAVIKFTYKEPLKVVQFSDSEELFIPQLAIAMGNPLGYDLFGSVTVGNISGLARGVPVDYDKDGVTDWVATLIQHSAALSPGYSGGPLFDLSGRVIGVNNMKIVDPDSANIGFAIPSNTALDIAEQLRLNGEIKRPFLGVYINQVELPSGIDHGVLITEVISGGSVDGSGIKAGDVIVKFNEQDILDYSDLRAALNQASVGDRVVLTINRNGLTLTFEVTLKAR